MAENWFVHHYSSSFMHNLLKIYQVTSGYLDMLVSVEWICVKGSKNTADLSVQI